MLFLTKILTGGYPNWAVSSINVASQAKLMSEPPPIATRLILATTGFMLLQISINEFVDADISLQFTASSLNEKPNLIANMRPTFFTYLKSIAGSQGI